MAVWTMTLDGETWKFDSDHMLVSEAIECEKLTGWTTSEWWDAFLNDRALAKVFFYWLARKRAGDPLTVPFTDVDFDQGAVEWGVEGVEVAEVPAELGVTDDEGPTGPAEEGNAPG